MAIRAEIKSEADKIQLAVIHEMEIEEVKAEKAIEHVVEISMDTDNSR